MYWLGLGLLVAAMLLYATEQGFFALLFALAGVAVVIGTALHRGAGFTGRKAKKSASKISEEIEKAEPQYPSRELIGEGLKNLGGKAGDHLFDDKKVWTADSKTINVRERAGRSSKTFVDKFLELFK